MLIDGVESMLSQITDGYIVENIIDWCDDWSSENSSESWKLWPIKGCIQINGEKCRECTKDDNGCEGYRFPLEVRKELESRDYNVCGKGDSVEDAEDYQECQDGAGECSRVFLEYN
jgi:hypothetical protein